MCDKFTYKIVNLKIQCKIRKQLLDDFIIYQSFNEDQIEYHSNFWVHRNKFVFTIFYSGHINITKIKTFSDIREALNLLLSRYNLEEKKCKYNDPNTTCCTYVDKLCPCFKQVFYNVKIDNMTVNGQLTLQVSNNILNLNSIKHNLTKTPPFMLYELNNVKYFIKKVNYDMQFFPGLFIKIEKDISASNGEIITKKWGTFILFSNGKFTLVGVKSSKVIFHLICMLLSFMFEK